MVQVFQIPTVMQGQNQQQHKAVQVMYGIEVMLVRVGQLAIPLVTLSVRIQLDK